jgi:hypothetical protein
MGLLNKIIMLIEKSRLFYDLILCKTLLAWINNNKKLKEHLKIELLLALNSIMSKCSLNMYYIYGVCIDVYMKYVFHHGLVEIWLHPKLD